MFHVPEQYRVREGALGSDSTYGNNGAFQIRRYSEVFWIIASDGTEADKAGAVCHWQHVSISFKGQPHRTPSWEDMCWLKSIFWDEEDTVIQIHPSKDSYVNYHPGCLHLWAIRPEGGITLPLPPSYLVGPKEGETAESCHEDLMKTIKEKDEPTG